MPVSTAALTRARFVLSTSITRRDLAKQIPMDPARSATSPTKGRIGMADLIRLRCALLEVESERRGKGLPSRRKTQRLPVSDRSPEEWRP